MNTLPLDLYSLIQFGLGDESWQEFVDRYEEKYDELQIDGFSFAPMQLGYTFQQIITSTGATPLPAYVDPESPGYEAALRSITGSSDNIPTQKMYYRLNRVTVREKLQLIQKVGAAALTPEMQSIFVGLLDESTDGLIKSFYNALTHQRMQIVSKGKFTIDATNNPRGLQGITIEFGIPENHFDTLSGNDSFWTNTEHITGNEGSTSDPILYMKNRIKAIRRTYHYYGPIQIEMAVDLRDDLLTHSKVLSRIGHAMYPNVTDETTVVANAKNYSDEALMQYMGRLVGATIVARDTYAYVTKPGKNTDEENDIVTTQIENFDPKNIAFIPTGELGTIMGVEPITLGYDPKYVASYSGGRLKLTQRAEPKTHSLYIESEAAQICVPSQPQAMFISTVTV